MKYILIMTSMFFFSASTLSAECTKEQKAQMIMNGIDQATMDKTCSKKIAKKVIAKKKVLKKRRTKPRRYAIKRERFYTSFTGSFYNGVLSREYYNDYGLDAEDEVESTVLKQQVALGYVFSNNNRIEFIYVKDNSYFEFNEPEVYVFSEVTSIGINYIHTLGNKQVEIGSIRPFLLVGVFTNEYEDNDGDFDYGSGIAIGAGVIYPLNNYVEFDLSFDVKHISWEHGGVDDYDVEAETFFTGISLAARYKF